MIRNERILLRAISPKDADVYEKWINDEETNHWRGLYHPTSPQEAVRWVETQMVTEPSRVSLAIEAQVDGKSSFIGYVGLRGICPRSRRAEIWIYIGDKAFWGKGLGQEATTALCRYAFEEMNLHRIWLELDPENVGAKKCYEKTGFVLEGTLRQAYYRRGKYRDTCMMGLLRPDFEARERKKT